MPSQSDVNKGTNLGRTTDRLTSFRLRRVPSPPAAAPPFSVLSCPPPTAPTTMYTAEHALNGHNGAAPNGEAGPSGSAPGSVDEYSHGP